MQQRNEYLDDMSAKLDDFYRKTSELRQKSKTVAGQARKRVQSMLADVDKKEAAARRRINELRNVAISSWRDIRPGLDMAMKLVSEAYKKAESTFEKNRGGRKSP